MSAVQPSVLDAGLPPAPPSRAPTRSDRAWLALLGAAVAGFFVVRGWLGACLVVAGVVSLWQCVVHRREIAPMLRGARVRWLLVAFAAPLAAAVLVNLAHGEMVSRSMDAAARMLLAGLVMLELARRRLDFTRVAHYAVPGAVFICAAWIFLAPEAPKHYWEGGRFATVFMDPLMLSLNAMVAAFLCLFLLEAPVREGRLLAAAKVAAIVLAVLVAVGTQSRTGWVMAPLLGAIWLVRASGKPTPLRIGVALAVVLAGCVLAYATSIVVRDRVNQAAVEVLQYLDGTRFESSIGFRISLFRIALLLFAQRPWFGWGFEELPELKTFAPVASFYSPMLDFYFVTAGVHNEFLQAMMRMGLAGLVSKLLLFGVPLFLFARACRSAHADVRTNGYLGLVVVIGYLTAGMSTEVTNLIYAASFYGLLVAVFAAGTLKPRP